MHDNLLIIFAKSPVKGKVKTRLAKAIGEEKALEVYHKLLAHTRQVTDQVAGCDKAVYHAEKVEVEAQNEQLWPQDSYSSYVQQGEDLGDRMYRAMLSAFESGYKYVSIIGTDCPELTVAHVQEAFQKLKEAPVVLGPATDGGYYLIGCAELIREIFYDKSWSTKSLLKETLQTLQEADKTALLLPPLSDIDDISDLEQFPAFGADPSASISG